MNKAALNGRGQNVTDITVPRVAARSLEVRNTAESARERWPATWTGRCSLTSMSGGGANGSINDSIGWKVILLILEV